MNTETGTIRYSNGGHNLPYILRKDGSVEELENTQGMLMGKFEPLEFESKSIQLEAGEKLLMYTDGVTEAMDEDQNMYEEERLEAYLKDRADHHEEKLVRGVLADVLKFVGKADQSDDITMLSIGYSNGA
jgi:sigma-B regulation protein RsbU (phosphoserine phosphatase)